MQSCKKISGNSATHKGGDMITQITMMLKAISTHATHKDGDDDKFEFYSQMITFQLTPPMWVATKCGKDDQDLESISTHASSTASRRHAKIFQLTPPIRAATTMFTSNGCSAGYFNSHHPCGWRQQFQTKTYPKLHITSTEVYKKLQSGININIILP